MITVASTTGQAGPALAWLADHPGRLLIDTETTGLNVHAADFIMGVVSIGHHGGDALVLEGRDRALVRQVLMAAFRDRDRTIWAHNASFDAGVFRSAVDLKLSSLMDSMTAAKVIWPGRTKGYSLKDLRPTTQAAQDALRVVWAQQAERFGCRKPTASGSAWLPDAVRHLRVESCPELAAYAAEDAVEGARLVEVIHQSPYLPQALVEVATDQLWRWVGYDGLRIDAAGLRQARTALAEEIGAATELYGLDVTANTKARSEWLTAHGVVPALKAKTGRPSLDKKHRQLAQVPADRQDWWSDVCAVMDRAGLAGKLKEISNALDCHGRVHPRIGAITPRGATGRMSIAEPALQNLSNAAVEPMGSLRGLLLADDGKVLVGADLDHVEPSMMAALSQDPALLAAVAPGQDPYLAVVAAVWGGAAVTRDAAGGLTPQTTAYRKRAKVILLALMYGMGVESLSRALGVSEAEASRLKRAILDAWPLVRRWIDGARRDAQLGVIQRTLAGRPIPRCIDAPYLATNYLIQGSAADLFKRMAARVGAQLPAEARLYLPIHDELVVECLPEDANAVADLMRQSMTETINGVTFTGEPTVLGERLAHA